MRLCPHPVGRTIGVSHRVGALVVPRRLRPLYCPWPRFFARFPGEFSAACTSPCCALRGISGGATMPYRSPGRFRFPHPTRPGFFLCTLGYEPAKPVHKKHNTRRCEHPSSGVPGSIGVGLCRLSRRRELRLNGVLRSSRQVLTAGTICSGAKRPPTRSRSGRKERTQCSSKA
jgi:hypothetical protein